MISLSETASVGDVSNQSSRRDQSPEDLLKIVLTSLEDAKAEDITTIDLNGKSSVSDYIVVTTGRSNRHVGAIADQLSRALKDAGHGRANVEGLPHCDWVLVDPGSVVVHIFRPEVREFYNLEKMWMAPRPETASDPLDTGAN